MDPNSPPPPSGLVLIDKPAKRAVSSMTACRVVKKKLIAGGVGDAKRRRNIAVGHAGTLDPLASGLLIVLVGRATRLCDQLMAGRKTYVAEIDLAHESNTDDLEGELVVHPPPSVMPMREDVERVLGERFTGEIQQRPPAFSAMWVNGQRAYELARKGRAPEMVPRPVMIHAVRVVEYGWPKLVIEVDCGKGTYIRSLARDVGVALTGHAGCLRALRRTAIGAYHVDGAWPLEGLPEVLTEIDLIQVDLGYKNPLPPSGGRRAADDQEDEIEANDPA
ncbi:MAG: tRNA pseudouridine(55) synthase TruB [Phycisphaerales bacterium]|nr:tRNA pseudouridine(55) synthase TruB [Phycisphaerales bacterium]